MRWKGIINQMRNLSLLILIVLFCSAVFFCHCADDNCTDDSHQPCKIFCNCDNYVVTADVIIKPCVSESNRYPEPDFYYDYFLIVYIEKPPTSEV